MKVLVDTEFLEVDALGEVYRSLVFDEVEYLSCGVRSKEKGCYDTFKVWDTFTEIFPSKYPVLYDLIKPKCNTDIEVIAYEDAKFVAMWWWDGDGTLLIWNREDKYCYVNRDCKCSYDWEEIAI